MQALSALFAAELTRKTPLIPSGIESENMEQGMGPLKSVDSPKQILQLCSIPLKIDLDRYKNAHSADNPSSNYRAAYLFSTLANTIPALGASFNPSPNLVTEAWDNIIHSANSTVGYTQRMLTQAKEKFKSSARSGMGGFPQNWYPVDANPSNWYEIIQYESNLIQLDIDLQTKESGRSDFIVMNEQAPLSWKVSNEHHESTPLTMSSATQMKKIQLSVLRIDFIRPWLMFELLNLQNWEIEGIDKSYYSSGNLYQNKGIFPLLPQSMLIGTKVSVEGDFSPRDLSLFAQQRETGKDLSLGPFLFGAGQEAPSVVPSKGKTIVSSTIKQVVGYISQLIPLSPGLPVG